MNNKLRMKTNVIIFGYIKMRLSLSKNTAQLILNVYITLHQRLQKYGVGVLSGQKTSLFLLIIGENTIDLQ